jgi:hypothetical protein
VLYKIHFFSGINSSGDVVVEDYTRIPTGPHTESGVDDPPFQSESFRTLVHTAGIFNPSSQSLSVLFGGPLRDTIFLIN